MVASIMVLWSKIIVMLRAFLTTASGLGHYFHLPLTYCSNLPPFSIIIYKTSTSSWRPLVIFAHAENQNPIRIRIF